jgi:amino acid adenylation domain-containing protein/non-ribosomal peptide synthase protein (TIGR01720 family)
LASLDQIAHLSPEKRKLLELLLKQQGVAMSRAPIIPQPRGADGLPTSFAQRRLWFLDQLEPGSPLYNIPTAVRLSGRLDPTALEHALNELVRRHETLRTTFTERDGEPIQVIAPAGAATLSLATIDLRSQPSSVRESAARHLALEEARTPFDLARGPLLRATLLQISDDDHIVLLTLHHIITDGWSMGVLIGELVTLYGAYAHGRSAPLPPLPIQYADFAHWQRTWLQGGALEEQIAYWKQQLGGNLSPLDLPTDRPRPARQSSRGAQRTRQLPRHLTDALRTLGSEESATLFMTLLAAFQTLLHRYSGQDDICVGTPIANRTRAELEGLIGFFANTLVLRATLSGEPSFRALLQQVREMALGAYAHQDLPFEMLVEALQPKRDLSRTPLFQAMFVLQNTPAPASQLPDLTLQPIEMPRDTSTFDLTLAIVDQHDGLLASIEYCVDLFDETTIERMLGQFEVLLEGIVANPDTPISRLPLLTAGERHTLLTLWNDTAAAVLYDRCLHQLFEEQAARTPAAIAIVAGDTRLTYGELNAQANQLARHLRSCGVGPDTLVGIAIERSPEMIVGLLGILKAGGAYLPLDPSYPAERLAFMREDARPLVLLTATTDDRRTTNDETADTETRRHGDKEQDNIPFSHSPGLPVSRSPRWSVVDMIVDQDAIARQPAENLAHHTTPDSLAYVIYTSGSTGQPKGVLVTHRAVVNHNTAVGSAFELRPSDRVLQFATISFDTAVEEIFPTLLNGAQLVLRPGDLPPSGTELLKLIEQQQLTVLDLPTAYWHIWAVELAQNDDRLPASLRLVIVGGEAATAERYTSWRKLAGPRIRWLNTYGPTETTVIATVYDPASDPSAGAGASMPLGRPIANTQVYILDRHGQPTPIGVPGELCIGGAGVARGYLNRPKLTAEKFVPKPFITTTDDRRLTTDDRTELNGGQRSVVGGRLYKTGDLARYLPDGNIEYLGRIDNQVKLRGFRVEPGEIEAALSQHPAVSGCVVDVREDARGEKQLVAYIVPRDWRIEVGDLEDSNLQPLFSNLQKELRSFLKQRLPDYMVPSAFVLLDALPLTPSGKIDRSALHFPDTEDASSGLVAPRTPTEAILANLWADVLGKPQIGIHASFFELGGHSLLATQLISRVRGAFRIELPLRVVFEAPTIAELAERIESARQAAAGIQLPPILAVARDGELPLSFGQQRLWFLDQLEPGSPLYNIPDAVRLTGPLNVDALRRGLHEIVRRHEVLRTTFVTVDGRPRQVIAPADASGVTPEIVDLRAASEADREEEAQRLAGAEARAPFDLTRGPLLRAKLLQLADEDYIALLTMHHIVSDGWSSGLLIRELAALYDAFANGRPSPLPELAIQYADFAHWQRAWLRGEALEAQLGYWKRQLGNAPEILNLPTDRPRPAIQSYRGAHCDFALPQRLSEQLAALSRQEGATLFMTLLAAWQVLLHRYSGQDDICVGTPIANRNRAEIESLIGFFINTLVLRADLSGTPTFRDLLSQVRETALGAFAHQDVPFELIVDAVQPERNLSHTPLFQVMFILQNMASGRAGAAPLSSLAPRPLETDSGISNFDLTLAIEEGPHGLRGALEYSSDLFDRATIERMIRHLQTLLEGIVADPDQPVDRLPLLSEAERRQLLVAWNDTASAEQESRCIHELFEQQAARTPDATAVIYAGQRLSYAELDARANQLAHYLRRLGVGPERPVGLCAERSLELAVALLGILKAGGAYVPLDPSYPAERLAFMLEDVRPVVVVTATSEAAPPLAGTGATVVDLRADWPSIAAEPDYRPQVIITPTNLAYVIYTSGSTGRPKGVLVAHGGVVNHARAVMRAFALQPTDRVLQFATITFDTAAEEIFPTWASGATLIMRPAGALLGGAELLQLIVDAQLTVLDLPTAYWHAWVAELEQRSTTLPPSLRLVVVGGEAALAERHAVWQRIAGAGVRWLNTYGPTEGTVIASLYEPAGEAQAASGALVPIGGPIANAQLYVLDRQMQPAPLGVAGELYIGGAGVARGYLNRPELTAEKFIPNPFLRIEDRGLKIEDSGLAAQEKLSSIFLPPSSTRLYKTGDRARYLPDGNIEFLGRVDNQVKLRGFRVELSEVEGALLRHMAIQEAAVVAREDVPGIKRLVAYVVPTTDHRPPTTDGEIQAGETVVGRQSLVGELRDFLKARLPDYMIPAVFVQLDALPLTSSAKVNHRALPAPDGEQFERSSEYAAPQTAAEQTLATIWAQVLGVRRVGAHDNFFELGGDSILSIQVIARANQAGLRLAPKHLFQAPTVAGLAALAGTSSASQAEQGIVTGAVPLTPIQRWFFEQDLPAPHHWNQALLLEVREPLARAPLERAIGSLLAHHDALRLRFSRTEAGWTQEHADLDGDVPLAWIDLAHVPAAEQGRAVTAAAGELQASLNLACGPLLRAAYFELGAERPGRLLLAIHHLAVDGVSWRILLEDLQAAYLQISRDAAAGTIREPSLPPKTTSFQLWARRLVEYAQSDALRSELDYWRALAGAAAPRLPIDFPGGDNVEASASSLAVELSAEQTRALLQDVPPVYNTDINDVLLAALAQAFARWTDVPVLLTELEGHGREDLFEDVDVSRTVGWFTSVYPVRLDLSDAAAPGEVLKTVKEQLRRIPRRGIGYGLLRYLSPADGDEASLSLSTGGQRPEVSFNYLGQFNQGLLEETPFGPAPESPGPISDQGARRSHLLDINGSITGGQLRIEWSYSKALHRPETIERVAEDFIAALQALIAHCQSPDAGGYTPSDFSLAKLDQGKLDKVLAKLGTKKERKPR